MLIRKLRNNWICGISCRFRLWLIIGLIYRDQFHINVDYAMLKVSSARSTVLTLLMQFYALMHKTALLIDLIIPGIIEFEQEFGYKKGVAILVDCK